MRTIRLKPLIYSVLIALLIIQVVLQSSFSVFQYYDEIIALLCLGYIFVYSIQNKVKKYLVIDSLIVISIIAIGLICNMVFELQSSYKAILIDIFNMFKAFVAFEAFYIKFENDSNQRLGQDILRHLNSFCIILMLPGFFLAIVNLFMDIHMHTEYVYGIRAFHYCFGRVGSLNAACVICVIIMTGYLSFLKDKYRKIQLAFIVMMLLLMLSTLRSRTYFYVVLYILGYYYMIARKRSKIKMRYVIIIGVLGILVSFPKIEFYFSNETTARSILLKYGIETARTYFPLGSGFATYGTSAAKDFWSPLYNRYNFGNYYGLSQDWGAFLTDNYWPAILGQFGIIGMLLIVWLIYRVYKKCLKQTDLILKFGALFGITCMAVSSLFSPAFFHFSAVEKMLMIALLAVIKKEKGNEYEDTDISTITKQDES